MRRTLRVLSSTTLAAILAIPALSSPSPAAADTPVGVTTTIYLLADQPEGGPYLLPVHREAPATLDLPRAAVTLLLAGPTQAELDTVPTISTAVPTGVDLLGLTIDGGVATVDLEGSFVEGGGSASMFARLGQLVFTLTRLDEVDEVALRLDGQPVEVFSGEGLVLDGPVGRTWFTEQDSGVVPPVLLETPTWEGTFAGHVAGTTRDPAETVAVGIWDTDGRRLGAAVVPPVADGRFSAWLPFDLPSAGYGAVIVEQPDGTGLREHLVRFAPDPVRPLDDACAQVGTRYFSDVSTTTPLWDAITCAVHWRVLVGHSDGTFRPGAVATRAQVASALSRLLGASGVTLPVDADHPFDDVATTSPHADAIAQLHASGVLLGLTSTRFGPDEPMSRGQLATVVHRSLGLFDGAAPVASEDRFGDDDGSVHEPAIDALGQLRVLAGTSPSRVTPTAAVTRAQLAAVLSRTADLLVASGHASVPANVFDVHDARVGDDVVGLTIASLDVSEPGAPFLTAQVGFTGELTVTGTVTAFQDHEQLGDAVCMTSVTPSSERSIPRMLQDTRYAWFCFTNSDVAAAEVFAPGTRTEATVVVDQFTINHAPTEVWNTARLLRVEDA